MKLQGQQARTMTEADYGVEALSSGEEEEVEKSSTSGV